MLAKVSLLFDAQEATLQGARVPPNLDRMIEGMAICVNGVTYALSRAVADALRDSDSGDIHRLCGAVDRFLRQTPSYLPPTMYDANYFLISLFQSVTVHLFPLMVEGIVPPSRNFPWADTVSFVCGRCHKYLPETLEDPEEYDELCSCNPVSVWLGDLGCVSLIGFKG